MKVFLRVFGIGALIGTALASYGGPLFLKWWWTPPTEVLVSCKNAVVWSMNGLLKAQLVGLLTGAFFSIIVYYKFFRRKKDSLDIATIDTTDV